MPETEKKKASFTARYIISAIVIRILMRMFLSNIGDGVQGYAIPLVGALFVAYMLPHMLERRKYENENQDQKELDE